MYRFVVVLLLLSYVSISVEAVRCYQCTSVNSDCDSGSCDAGFDGMCYKQDVHIPQNVQPMFQSAQLFQTNQQLNMGIPTVNIQRGCMTSVLRQVEGCTSSIMENPRGATALTCLCRNTDFCNSAQINRSSMLFALLLGLFVMMYAVHV